MLQKKKKIDPANFFQMNEQNCPRNYNSYLKSTDTDKKEKERRQYYLIISCKNF